MTDEIKELFIDNPKKKCGVGIGPEACCIYALCGSKGFE